MPKRAGYIWEDMTSKESALVAILNASKKKRDRPAVKEHLGDALEDDAKALSEMVRNGEFTPSPTIRVIIKDGPHKKEREIFIPRFWPDQCVHWMVMQKVGPLIMRGMYEYNCGSVTGRGTKAALDCVQIWLETDPKNCTWCIKIDVEQFYKNIDHDVLKRMFRRIIKDPQALYLIDLIIDSHPEGVPIGFYTSQWFANFYMQTIDHYIKEVLHIPHYVHYADDMLLFGPNKRDLLKAREAIAVELEKIGLHMKDHEAGTNPAKPTWEIFKPREAGLSYLGTRFYAIRVDETKHRYKWVRVLSRDNMLRMTRRVRKIHRKGTMTLKDASQVISDYGRAREGNNWQFEVKHLRPYVDFDEARRIVSEDAKLKAAAQKAAFINA